MIKTFDDLLKQVKECTMKKISVAVAQDEPVLEAVRAAKDRGIADAILVGDKDKIEQISSEKNINISDFEIIDVKDIEEAARTAVKLVHDGTADMYMKGICETKTVLRCVLDKEIGLRTGNPLSHVGLFEIPGIDHLVMLTDCAFIPYPTLEDKVHIIENTVRVAHAIGIENPKLAPICAVEVINPKMPCTVEAAELKKMNEEGKITGCMIDGPLSMDIALYPEAAAHKGATDRPVAGHADIVLFPDIHAGNVAYKILVHSVKCKNAAVATGTSAPVIITSRADSFETKINSITLAAILADKRR